MKKKTQKQNRQYDCFVVSESFGGQALKGLQHFSRASYGQAALRGAGVGASVGGVGNMVNNVMKRDDDPTKVGLGKAFIKGAAGGATTGAALGMGTRFVTNRQFAQDAMQNLAQKVHAEKVTAAGRQAANNAVKSGITDPRRVGEEVRKAEIAANQSFAKEYGYKYFQGKHGGPDQLKITTGQVPWTGEAKAARRRYYDLQSFVPDYIAGEERQLPEVLTQAANRRY